MDAASAAAVRILTLRYGFVLAACLGGMGLRAEAQEATAVVTGRVVDAATGEALVGANVLVPGTLSGAVALTEGRFTLAGLPPGRLELQASMAGYRPRTQRVTVAAGDTARVTFRLRPDLDEQTAIAETTDPFGLPPALFFSVPKDVDLADDRPEPVRSIAGAAALLPGVDRTEGTRELALRGAPPGLTAYRLGGLPIGAVPFLPWDALDAVHVYADHIPARYGDVLSGVVDVETRAATGALDAAAEGLFSDGLDAYGYREGLLSLGLPLLTSRFRLFVSGAWRRQGDAAPSALGQARLRDGLLEEVLAQPQAVEVVSENDPSDVRYVPFPVVTPGTPAEDVLARLPLPDGYRLPTPDPPSPLFRPSTFTAEDFTRAASQRHNGASAGSFFGRFEADLRPSLTLALGGHRTRAERDTAPFSFTLYNDEPLARTETRTRRLFAELSHTLSEYVSYDVAGHYLSAEQTTYDARFSPDVSDVLLYGDIDHPANAVASRYRRPQEGETYVGTFGDGLLPDGDAIWSLFAAPGALGTPYSLAREDQVYLDAHTEVRWARHRLEVGLELDRRTRRAFLMAFPSELARYANDGDVEAGTDHVVDRYEDLPYALVADRVSYYGYDYLGLAMAETGDLDAFAQGANFDMAPFEPRRYGAYAADRITYGRLTFDAGLRLDRFSHTGGVLQDPFALFPIYRAGDLRDGTLPTAVAVPTSVGDDYALYFDAGGRLTGYRDRGGLFYGPDGQRAEARTVRGSSGSPRIRTDEQGNEIRRLTDDLFEAYVPRWVLQPRLALNVRLSPHTLVFGYANRLARQPLARMPATFHAYDRATQGLELVNNPDLSPEKATSYGLGLRQRLGRRAVVTGTAFLRRYDDLVEQVVLPNVFPNNYQTYRNRGEGKVRGLELAVAAQRTQRLHLEASYTLQEAEQTNPDLALTALIAWQGNGVDAPHFRGPADVDRRHQIKVLASYRLERDEGPVLLGRRLLENTTLAVFADVKSGRPYTALTRPYAIYGDELPVLKGRVNGERLPWTGLVNLRLERRLDVAAARLTAYLWVENLFDTDNVLGVYGATGEPGSDGYLSSERGRDVVFGIRQTQGDRIAQSFADHYALRQHDPAHYGIPRQIRLGLRLAL